MADPVETSDVDWDAIDGLSQPTPSVGGDDVDWSAIGETATPLASPSAAIPAVGEDDVNWSAIDAGPAQDEFTLPPGGELLGTYPPGDYENVQTGERFSVANTIQNVDMSGVEEAQAPEGISPNLGLQLPVKSIDLGEGREAVVPTNVQSGINWVSDIKPEKVERTQVRPGVYKSGGEYEIGDASLKMSKLGALERLSEQVFSEDMFPEAQMGVGIPTIINSMKKAELLRPDPDDAEKYWLELTEEDGSAGEPKLVTKGEAEAIARGILSKQMQEDRDRTRKTLSRARDPQQKAEALYSFLYTYYPEAAKVAVRDNPLFTSVDFEEGPPWYANISGVMNVLDVALPPLAVTRKVGLEVKNTVIKERLIEGQSDDWDFETNKTIPFDENMKGLVNDYLATNNGYRMENGNYLLPKWFGPTGSSAPSVWPEGLEPDIKPGAPFSAAGGFNPARAALADNEYNRNIVKDIESRIEAGELRWKKPGLGRSGELEVVSGESVSDNAQDIYREVKTGDWSQSVLEKSYVAQTGLPGTTVIEGQEFSVLSPRQFRALLLEDLEQHVSLSGKLKAPLRWAGLQRGFSEIDPAEEWRRLGLRRFIGGSRGTPGEVHLTGDHFPGYTATKKVGEFGVPTDAKFVEDLAKAVSAVGGPGRAISDDVAYESGKDIAALIALPGRGLQDLWRVADEQVLDLMEMGAPETWRRDPSEDPGYVGIPGILGVPEIDSRSAQNLAEILTDPGDEASTGFKYDPEAGIDPLGNLTLELATLFAADPYGMKAAGRMLGGGARGAQAAAKPSMVHSRVGLLTKEGGDALDAMTVTRIQEAADKLGVGMAELPSYARHQAMRQATNDFARAHSEARASGKAIEDISYQTDIATGADGSEKLVVRDLFVGSPEGAPFIRPDINVQATDDLGVELVGGIFPRQTAKRTQFQYGQAYRRQVSSILDGIRAQGGARARAVDAAAKVFEAAPNVALKPLRWLDRVVGTDWVKVGGATPKEAWGIVRSSLEDLGYSASEIADFSNKTLNRLQGELAEKYPDFNLANYTPEDLIIAARLKEVNADIIVDERLMTEAVAPLREFLDGARAFEDEFLRMDGTFRLFLQDPRGRQAIEELRLAQWKQKYREIAAQHPPGSDERVTAVRDSMIALQNDYEAIQYTLGRMERSGEVRALEDAMVESLEHAELLEARALDVEGKIPRKSARRVRTPKSLTPQETVDEFVNTAISARDEIADLRAEIERLRLDLVDEVPKEQRAAARLQDKEIKKALKGVGKRKIDSLKKELEKLEARYAEFQRAYEDSVDMPAFFFPERRGLDEALTTRASWGKDTSISIPGTSETIRGERAGDFVVHKNYTVTDAGTVVPKKDYALSYAPEGAPLERVAHGFKNPRDAKSFGDVATGVIGAAEKEGGGYALNLLHEMGVAGKVIYRDKKVFKPWEIQAGLGIGDAAEWTAKAQRAVRDQRQLSKMRESIETKRKQLGAIETDLGAKIKKPSKWRDDIQSNRAVRREIAARERTVRQLERMASSADRGAGQATKAIAREKVAIQRVARSELRKKMAGEVRQLRGSARQSRWEHARRRNELRDVLDDIKAEARETAAALAVPRAIQEFNRAAEVAVNAKSSFAPGAAEKVIEDILLPYGTASRSWRYQGIKKKLTDKQLRLPEADRLTALNAQKGKQVKGFVQARSYAEAEKKLRDKGVAVIEELEAGARSKLQEEIDDLQREIGEMLNPATKGAGQLEASTPMDLMQMLGLTEDATPFQIVERVLKNQDEALKVDIQLARAVPGYDKKMDNLLSTLESLTESERFLVSDFLKFESAPGKAPRGGRYAGLTAEQEHLRPVIELFRGYYSEMLNLLKDQGMFRDWSLYEFLDRTNVGSYIHHTLAEAGFGLTGKAAQTARKAAAQGRLLPSEAGLTRYRGIPGAIHEINDAMRWQVAESIVKNQIKLGMHGPDAAKALAARGPVPQELVESVVREVPADLRYFQENPLLIASNYSINVGKVIGNRRFWDDMAFVVDTYFPEASKLSRLISDPKLVMKEAEASYQARRTEAIRRGDPVPERGAEVTYEVGLRELDRQAALMADKINPMTGKKYGEKFVRLGGADYLSLVTNGKFPSGDKAVLDAIDLMVTQGVDAQKVQEELLTRFGLELTVPEVQGFYRGQTYLPESLANFVKAQLGHSSLAIGIKGLPSDLKVPAQLALDVLDNINEIFKGLVTVVWPRFHGRNAWSGLIANAMVHGEIAVRPEFQKKVIMVLSKEGHEIPFTFGGITKTGLEWQDVLRRLRVSPDRGAVADLEGIAAGAPGALLGPTELERMQAAASRVVQNVKSGEGRLTEWDNLIEFLYDRAHFKDTRAAFHAEKPAIMSGRLRTGPFGKALTGTGLGALSGFSAGMAGGGPLVGIPSGLVGAAIGYMSTLPARNLVTLGGEIGRGTEMQLRSSNFFAGLEKGHSLDEAAHLATMTHFNYRPHGQSWFSYNVMRRAMPFWTWNSKNFKKQLWLMRHRPQEYAALQHILTAVTHHEKSPELEATLPKNFASRVAFLTREGAYHGFGTPFEAFVESVRPSTEGGMIGTAGAGGLAHPGFQWLYEEGQGRSMYFDKDLTEIRGARDLEYTFPFLQEYFGAGPDSRGVWKIGQLDPLAEENRGKPWIPTQEEAPIRWNRAKKLNAFAGILSLWQQLRAESYQDAYGELDPAGMKVSFPERAARLGLSWRKYSYDPDIERARIKAWSRFSRELTNAYGEADREGTLDLPLILKEEGSDRFMNEESRLLLEQLGLGAEARP